MPCRKLMLLTEIEELRLRLYSVAGNKDLVDPEVLNLSRRLDRLLNEYYKCASRKKTPPV